MTKEQLAIKIADTLVLYLKVKQRWVLERDGEKASIFERHLICARNRIRRMVIEYIDSQKIHSI